MCIVPILVDDIAETQHIELSHSSMAGCVNWKQDGESHATSDKSHRRSDLEVSQEEKGIKRVMVKDIAVRNFIEDTEPIEQPFR